MKNYLKGIVAGLGGVAPGLSGSVLLIIMGLYQKTLDALGNLFSDFKKNVRFLLPVVAGMFTGVLLFSKILDFFLNTYEMQTRFCFLGLIIGTVPLFYREVKKEGFSKKYYIVMLVAAIFGTAMFTMNPNGFKLIIDSIVVQSVALGVAVAATAIVPGIDPAVLLSTMGLYEAYVSALANLDMSVLAPMVVGLAGGAIEISLLMSKLFARFYTFTFSVVFGVFLSMIPNMLNETCVLGWNIQSTVSIAVMIVGFFVSFYLGDIETNNRRLKKLFGKD